MNTVETWLSESNGKGGYERGWYFFVSTHDGMFAAFGPFESFDGATTARVRWAEAVGLSNPRFQTPFFSKTVN